MPGSRALPATVGRACTWRNGRKFGDVLRRKCAFSPARRQHSAVACTGSVRSAVADGVMAHAGFAGVPRSRPQRLLQALAPDGFFAHNDAHFMEQIRMWFRNLQLYRLGQDFTLTPEELDARMQASAFRGCGRMELLASGWAPPLGRAGQQLVHAANGYCMICLRREEKILPAGVIRQLLEDKVAEVEAAEGREVYRRERMRMKEEIIVDLLPRALTRVTNLFAYLDVRLGLLVVDSASAARAETLVSQLRTTLGRFPATPLQARHALPEAMTRWVTGATVTKDFLPGDECLLRHPDPDGGMISCRHQDLGAAEVRNHIRNGKFVVRLAMHWRERLAFVLHEDLSIHRLRFEDVVREPEQDTQVDDPVSRFDLDFSLMALELAEFLPALLAALGGEESPGRQAGDTSRSQTRSSGRGVPEAEPA